ncbi:MAG: dipeptidase [Chloroflexota bacterium]
MTGASARELHEDAIVVDAHSDVFCDVVRRRLDGETGVLNRLHLPAWREAGVNVVVTTLYTEPEHKPDRALQRAITMLGAALNDIEETPDVRLCRTRAEIEATVADGTIAFVLGMEGGEPVQSGIEALRTFHELGVRVLGFTWNQRNLLADGIGEARANGGLTELGREMAAEANRLGILLDVSHLTPRSFWDLIEVSEQPVIASHSNAISLCKHPRNIDDEQIAALAKSGGFIGINAVAPFIADDPNQASLDLMLDHLDHAADIAGIENIALGPDFVDYLKDPDGPETNLRLKDISYARNFSTIAEYPNVTAGLVQRGYSEAGIRGILGLNFLRVFEQVCG